MQKEATCQLVQDMLEKDVIQRSCSSWAAPVILVKKKDGSLRLCIDYRRLNEVTRKEAYPLPRVDDTLDTLAGSKWFSTLDLESGYWQVEVHHDDREKTAFCTPKGLLWVVQCTSHLPEVDGPSVVRAEVGNMPCVYQ